MANYWFLTARGETESLTWSWSARRYIAEALRHVGPAPSKEVVQKAKALGLRCDGVAHNAMAEGVAYQLSDMRKTGFVDKRKSSDEHSRNIRTVVVAAAVDVRTRVLLACADPKTREKVLTEAYPESASTLDALVKEGLIGFWPGSRRYMTINVEDTK